MPIRKNVAVRHDPYLPWGGMQEVAVCKRCGAVYHHKRWAMEGPPAVLQGHTIRSVLCPACRRIHDHFPGGIITLRGGFLNTHKDQILHLVKNEEARAKENNPLERIISIKDWGNHIEIHTTNERFAQRIGKEIQRAYKGDATYHWSLNNHFVRVEWHREED